MSGIEICILLAEALEMPHRVYLFVECNRDEMLLKTVKERDLIGQIDIVPKHLSKPINIMPILHVLNVYPSIIIATDLENHRSPNDLCSQFAQRINGSQISGKTFRVLDQSDYKIEAELDGKQKYIGIVALGLLTAIAPNIDFHQHMVEDYYIRLMYKKGMIQSVEQNFQTSKELVDSITNFNETDFLQSCNNDDLSETCNNIITTITRILAEIS